MYLFFYYNLFFDVFNVISFKVNKVNKARLFLAHIMTNFTAIYFTVYLLIQV